MKRVLLCVIAAIIIAGGYFFLHTPIMVNGTVVTHSQIENQWGIHPKGILFYGNTIFVDKLPGSLQKQGLTITCPYRNNITEVLDTGDWGIVIDGSKCTTSEVVPEPIVENNEWKTYTNQTLGFSINIPQKIYSQYACPDTQYSDILILEEGDSVRFGIDCIGTVKSLEASWDIKIFDNVKDVNTVSALFKKTYFSNCTIDRNFIFDENGTAEIRASNYEEPVDESSCFINYATHFKYNPTLKKVATWNIGQEGNFWKEKEGGAYDEEMSESFKFIVD